MKSTIFVLLIITTAQLAASNFNLVADNNFYASDFSALGASYVDAKGIRITQQGDASGSLILYNQKLLLANGFTTSFVLNITNCDTSGYDGADGFAFVMFPNIPSNPVLAGGSSLGITTLSNFAAVPFMLRKDMIGLCALNSSVNLGGGSVSVSDNSVLCSFNSSITDAMRNLRCSGPHTINITFTAPDQWEIVFQNTDTFKFSFTRNTNGILDWDYNAYVGFSGGVAAGYMNQYIKSWSLTVTPGCLGVCSPIATCTETGCQCPSGYDGDGTICLPLNPPSAKILPIIECFEDLGYGSYRAHFGYQSFQNETVVIAQGTNNQLIGTSATNLLTTFAPAFYPLSAFQVDFSNTDTITWRLTDYEVTLNVSDRTRLCPVALKVNLLFYSSPDVDPSPIVNQLTDQLQVSYGRIKVSNLTLTDQTKKRSQIVADLELEIAATNSTTQTEPSAADTVVNLVETSENTTRMNEIINQDQNSPNNEFISTKIAPTGIETVGQQVSPPIVSPSAVPVAGNVPAKNTPINVTSDATIHQLFIRAAIFSAVLVAM